MIEKTLEFLSLSSSLFWIWPEIKRIKSWDNRNDFLNRFSISIRQSTNENVIHVEYCQFREKSIGRRTEEITSSQASDSPSDNACDVSAVFPPISELKEVGHILPRKLWGSAAEGPTAQRGRENLGNQAHT